jgi:hypothetical protein
MRTYTLEVVIREGSDEWWENIEGTGCDEVRKTVMDTLEECGFITEVKLKKFKDDKEENE